MLKILDDDEYTARKTIDKLNEENRAIDANLPFKRKLLEKAKGRVDTLHPKIVKLNLERADPESDKIYVIKQREIREESLEHFESLPEHEEVKQAREDLQAVISLRDINNNRITFLKNEIPNLEKRAKEKLISVNRFKTKGLQDPSRIEKNWCPNSYQKACDNKCVEDHEIGENTILSELEEEAKELNRNYEVKKTDLAKLESEMDQQEAKITTKREALQTTIRKHPSPATQIQQQIDKLELLESYLDEEIDSASNVRRDSKTLDANRKELEKSNAELKQYKEEANDKLKVFSDIFGDVTRAVVGSSIKGSVILTKSSGLKPRIEKKRELGGAAMETVKTIAFDLASMIQSSEGNGFHPRFLIHDGPRESDMAQVMYEHFFRYMQKLEQEFPENSVPFQYILTTTTPPPQGMRENTKWLLGEKLSGKNEKGRLLRQDF